MFWSWAQFQQTRDHGKENETKKRPSEITDAAAAQPAARRKVFRSARKFRAVERTIFSWTPARIQGGLGPETEAAAEGLFYFWDDSGRGSRDPDQPTARSAFRSTVVPPLHSLSRDAARGGAGGSGLQRTTPGPHRKVLRAGAQISAVSKRAPLGRRESRALPTVVGAGSSAVLAPRARRSS